MKPIHRSIAIAAGQIVQLTTPPTADVQLIWTDEQAKSLRAREITPHTFPRLSTAEWTVGEQTIDEVLNGVLADVPLRISKEEVAELLDLTQALATPVALAAPGVQMRLHSLRALLDGTEVIIFRYPEQIEYFTELLDGLLDLSYELDHGARPHSFVIYGAEELPGVAMLADRVLNFERGKLKEIAVFW